MRFNRIHPNAADQTIAVIIMHPMVAKGLLRTIDRSIKEWEQIHGEIHMPDDVELIENLFRAKFLRPGEEDESKEE